MTICLSQKAVSLYSNSVISLFALLSRCSGNNQEYAEQTFIVPEFSSSCGVLVPGDEKGLCLL